MGWRFPLRFGARDTALDVEHRALLNQLEPGFDVSEGTGLWIETRADALASVIIWRVNARVANQNNPLRMLENLPSWEESCGLRPSVTDTDVARRRRLAARLRGLGGNALQDIEDTARKALGVNFVAFLLVAVDDEITYWPGLNPGPPGFEWSSNRATVGIQISRQQLTDGELRVKRDSLIQDIDRMRPAWMTYVIGTDDTFICGVGIIGQSVLA